MWHEERLYIDGELVAAEGGATYENVDPSNEQVLGVAADASSDDVRRAIAAARRAFDETGWSTDIALRVRCLRQLREAMLQHHQELGDILTAEVGAPALLIDGPMLGVPRELLGYYADMAESYEWITDLGAMATLSGNARRWIEREPAGVVGAISPWNYPMQINLAKLAPALATGCTVVLKSAPDTPWSALALGRLVAEHTDMPAGVFNVITSADRAIGEVITTDPRVDLISFTGSTAVGRRIMEAAAPTIKRLFLELGGKSATIVLDDVADMTNAVAGTCFQICTHGAQGCATTSRLLLPRSRYEEGVQAAAALLAALPYGEPRDPGNMTGPVINRAQRDRIEAYIQQGIDEGARLVMGGVRPPQFDTGFWVQPTLFADVDNQMTIAREEIFGPVLVAIPYDDEDDAVRIANDSIFGLSGAVISDDRDHAMSVARRIRTGTMSINGGLWYGADVPFGGYKQSGVGREMGVSGFEEYLEQKAYAEPVASA